MDNRVNIVIGTMPHACTIFEYVQYYMKSIFAEDYGFEQTPPAVSQLSHLVLDQFIISAASSNISTQITAFHNTLAAVYSIVHARFPMINFWQIEQLCYEVSTLPAYEELVEKIDTVFTHYIANRSIWKFDIAVDHRKLVIGVGSGMCD